MKLKFWAVLLLCLSTIGEAAAADAGLRYINARGRIKCGTNLASPAYASQDENGMWKGFDVDMCQAISIAIFGAPDKYEMVDVRTDQIAKYLKSGRIDVMMGGSSLAASAEARSKFAPAAILYYDKQVFLARKAQGAKSMEDYRFANVCVVNESNDTNNVEDMGSLFSFCDGLTDLTSGRQTRLVPTGIVEALSEAGLQASYYPGQLKVLQPIFEAAIKQDRPDLLEMAQGQAAQSSPKGQTRAIVTKLFDDLKNLWSECDAD